MFAQVDKDGQILQIAEGFEEAPFGDAVLIPDDQSQDIAKNPSHYIHQNGQFILTEAHLNTIKQRKKVELDAECNRAILAGFTSATTGHFYKFDQEAQDNFSQQSTLLLLKPDISEVYWKTEDAGIVLHTRDQFINVVFEAGQHKQQKIAKYWTLKAQVQAATTRAEVDAINW